MSHPSIFISYRIADSLSYANSLSLSFEKAFGEGSIFHDKSSLKPGMKWPEELAEKVKVAKVVLVLVANAEKWLALNSNGLRRMDDPEDWVRKEVETALADDKKLIIPVLIDDARLPSKNTLPETMRALLNIQYKQLRVAHWNDDIKPLIIIIGQFLGSETGPKSSVSDLEHQGLEQQLNIAIQKLQRLQKALLLENNPSLQFTLEHDIQNLETIVADLKSKLKI